jgi:hypothetical protein
MPMARSLSVLTKLPILKIGGMEGICESTFDHREHSIKIKYYFLKYRIFM